MPLPKIQILSNPEELVLLINGFVHLHLVGFRKGIIGWIESEVDSSFQIQWYVDDRQYETKYWSKALWLRILKEYQKKVVKIKTNQ